MLEAYVSIFFVSKCFLHFNQVNLSLYCVADINECSDGFVQCDSRAICVNLPGWYHCECRDGYHDNGIFSSNGDSCEGRGNQEIDLKPYFSVLIILTFAHLNGYVIKHVSTPELFKSSTK